VKKLLTLGLVALAIVVSTEEVFFGGKFVLHYTEDTYSYEWLKEYVTDLRKLHKLSTEDRYVLELKKAIDTAAAKTGLDPLLIIAVITVESEFRNVIGSAGELGLMQIKPETAQFISKNFDLPVPNDWKALLWDYELNILYGSCYLKYLLDKFGNLRKALEYYNGGSYRKEYAEKILTLYEELKAGHL
jgi:soluble lytic murein transglycosylase